MCIGASARGIQPMDLFLPCFKAFKLVPQTLRSLHQLFVFACLTRFPIHLNLSNFRTSPILPTRYLVSTYDGDLYRLPEPLAFMKRTSEIQAYVSRITAKNPLAWLYSCEVYSWRMECKSYGQSCMSTKTCSWPGLILLANTANGISFVWRDIITAEWVAPLPNYSILIRSEFLEGNLETEGRNVSVVIER